MTAPWWDTANLRKTSDADNFPWRWQSAPLIKVSRKQRTISYAKNLGAKRELLETADRGDVILAAWPGEYSQDVFVVDDKLAALDALSAGAGKR